MSDKNFLIANLHHEILKNDLEKIKLISEKLLEEHISSIDDAVLESAVRYVTPLMRAYSLSYKGREGIILCE